MPATSRPRTRSAPLGLWQPGAHRGAGRVNEPGAWSMSALTTPDPEAGFYGAVFGWELGRVSFGEATADLFRLPGYVGGEPQQPVPRDVIAVLVPAEAGAPARRGVDFRTRDLDRAGRVVVPPGAFPPFRQAVLADPRGGAFGLSELAVPPG